MEGLIPRKFGHDAVEIPGARSLLEHVIRSSCPWAIVTSGTVPLVSGWLEVLALPRPEHMVTAESVQIGKPDPTCYLMGLDRLGRRAKAADVLVLEDSPAGIRAGKAAGCKVLGLVTSHSAQQVLEAEPDWIVRDLQSVTVVRTRDGTVTLEISQTLAAVDQEGHETGGDEREAGWLP